MLDSIRNRAQSWGVKIIFGIIIIVFVFWGMGSVNQPSRGAAAVVNGKSLSMEDYRKAYQAEVDQFRAQFPGVDIESLEKMGLRAQVMHQMISQEMLRQEADRLNIVFSPAELRAMILSLPYLQKNGVFSKEAYEHMLASVGKSAAAFEADLAREMREQKIQGYITAATGLVPGEARRIMNFQMQRRTASYVLFATADYMDQVNPDEETLKQFYQANIQRYSNPDRTSLRYLELSPASLAPLENVPEEKVDALYAEGPQRFELRSLIVPLPEKSDEAAEKTAREQLQSMVAKVRGGEVLETVLLEEQKRNDQIQGGYMGWLNRSQLGPELIQAVLQLKKNEISDPVRLPQGFAAVQLIASDPDWSLPEAEIKGILRRNLAEEQASYKFRDIQEEVEDSLALGKTLDELASHYGLHLRVLPLGPREGIPAAMGLTKDVPADTFSGPEGSVIHTLLETDKGFLAAAIQTQVPAGPMPFEEIRESILQDYKTTEAGKLAEAAANEAVKEFKDGLPAAYNDKVMVSAAFTRNENIEGFGPSGALVAALFDSAPGVWLDRPYAVASGVVLAATAEILPLSDDEWAAMEGRVTVDMLNNKKSKLYSASMLALGKKTKLEIPDTSILEPR